MIIELSENCNCHSQPLGNFWDDLGSVAGSAGGSAAAGAAIGSVVPGIGTAIGAAAGLLFDIGKKLFSKPQIPQSALDPNSPNYDPAMVALYAASDACIAAGGTLMTDGRCIVQQGNQTFDLFAPSWRLNRVYVTPGAQLFPAGSPECGGTPQSAFIKPGANGCYRPQDSFVELINPAGQILTLTFYQWKAVVDRGGIDVSTGNVDASIIKNVTGTGLNPDGSAQKPNILIPAAVVAGLSFLI